MLTKSSLLPLVVIEPVDAGCASTRFSATSAAAVTCAIMKPGFQARVSGEKRRQFLVERRVHQAVDAALGDAGQRRQRDGQEIQLERQRLAVEVAAGKDLVAEHQRIVGGRIQLDREHAARFRQRVAHGAVDLRRAAQRVGVLHAAAGDVRLADLAAFEQLAQPRARSPAGPGADAPRGCGRRRPAACRAARRASARRPRRRCPRASRRRRVPGSRSRASPACR